MKKTKKYLVLILLFLLIVFLTKAVLANETTGLSLQKIDYSEDFKRWLELSDEEKKNTIMPRMYEVTSSATNNRSNLVYRARLLGSSLNSIYSLKSDIPDNLVIRDQKETNSCWAFAGISSLETNLALSNLNNGIDTKIYDFSERHMEYTNSQSFTDNAENPYGYNREAGDGGDWYLIQSYLTNGLGAINEEEMQFENNENPIDITGIQNKNVVTQVYDTIEFPNYRYESDEKKVEIMNQIKQHIKTYGSIYASIHGNSAAFTGECYNNDTGAKFCNSSFFHVADHAISIIGWDDNYSVDNFAEGAKPTSNGAWIVRNSWGERYERNLLELKQEMFDNNTQVCISRGWNSAVEIPNEIIEENGYTIENDIAYIKIGNNGIIYVSYEDCNISTSMYGIVKASDSVDYDNIYQYDEFYPCTFMRYSTNKIMLCNVFDKKTSGQEYLTQVALYTPQAYKCKVYVNPNGDSKSGNDMQLVQLKAGETETFDAGYHTLEFAKPIEITGNKFAVVVEVEAVGESILKFSVETKSEDVSLFDSVKVETGKCFVGIGNNFDDCEWTDLGRISSENETLPNGDSTIKAFTTNELIDESLRDIEIVTPPDDTEYFEGENFNPEGMVVRANYNSRKNPYVILDSSSYNIEDGTNLALEQETVTITYEGKSVTQSITVEKNSVTELTITTPPTNTEYKEGQNFDRAGMVVEATFKDGTTRNITDYEIPDGNNLEVDQTKVTISYEDKTVDQAITVIPNPLVEIKITKAPNRIKYVVGQSFDKTGMIVTGKYQDGSTQEIIDYIVENGTDLIAEQTSVTIKYGGKTVEQLITVEEKTITEIKINKMPSKIQYIQNKENLDLSGGSITAIYNDGTNEVIQLNSEDITISGFNNKNIGENAIVVEYETKTTTFKVEIIAEAKPENSELDNANIKVSNAKYYTYSDSTKKEYMIIDVIVNGIIRNTKNDEVEYYYYLSPNQEENSIADWVKIDEIQESNDSIKFKINTKDIENYDDLLKSGNIYLYIKEVAKLGGNQQVKVSKSIKMDSDVEIETYLDDVKKEANPSNANEKQNEQDKKEEKNDNTTADKKFPNTGKNAILVLIIAILVVAIIKYVNYKRIEKI